MTITSYVNFVDNLHAIEVTGVTRRTRNPPDKINTTDLPWRFIRAPEGEEGAMTADGEGGWPQFRAELVIIVEPTALNTQPTNFNTCVTLMDALSDKLRTTRLAKTKNIWSMRVDRIAAADAEWWAVICEVAANG